MKLYQNFNKLPYYDITYFEQAKNSGPWNAQCDKPHKPEDFEPSENIDRIKLPCFCTYEWRGKRRLGMLVNNRFRVVGLDKLLTWIVLIDMNGQSSRLVGNMIDVSSLKNLIDKYKINIGKVEINYYEVI